MKRPEKEEQMREQWRTNEKREKKESKEKRQKEDGEQIRKTQDKPQWIVAQGLLSALTIPGFS